MPKNSVKFSISLPLRVAKYLDTMIDAEEVTKSAYIAQLIREDQYRQEQRLKRQLRDSDSLQRALKEITP